MVADVSMARQNRPRAGISACYAGPMFSILSKYVFRSTRLSSTHQSQQKAGFVVEIGEYIIIVSG